MGICEKNFNLSIYRDYLYFVFRVFVGLLFLQHGLQKMFGMFGGLGGTSAELFSLMGLAGIIETVGGLFIAFGLFTRLIAFLAGIEMLVAYSMVHAPSGLIPLLNQGELALLYFASFLVIIMYGAGKWSLEKALMKEEAF